MNFPFVKITALLLIQVMLVRPTLALVLFRRICEASCSSQVDERKDLSFETEALASRLGSNHPGGQELSFAAKAQLTPPTVLPAMDGLESNGEIDRKEASAVQNAPVHGEREDDGVFARLRRYLWSKFVLNRRSRTLFDSLSGILSALLR